MALTDIAIKTKKPAAKPYRLYDRDGLFLLIKPNGSKLWRLKYRFHGRPRLMAMGSYPDVTLTEVRKQVSNARNMLADDRDPLAERMAEKESADPSEPEVEQSEQPAEAKRHKGGQTPATGSFKAIALRWHEWWSSGVNADTAGYIMRRLEGEVFPRFGNTPINSIRAVDIRNLILDIESGKGETRRFEGKGARDVAQRQHQTLAQIFRWAVSNDLAERNPATDFKPSDVLKPHKTQNRARVEESELPALLVAMDEYDRLPVVHYALKLISLTFVRTQELLQAPWSEFHFDRELWIIPGQRMKMEGKHYVPLSRQALEILRELQQLAGAKKFVFPGLNKQTEHRTINENSLLNALNEIGYKGVMTGHGYRGLAGTVLAEHGFDEKYIEVQLSHAHGDKTKRAYIGAKYLEQRTPMMAWWANHLDAELAKGRAQIAPVRHSAA